MFHADHSAIQVIAHLCIGSFFLVIGLRNLSLTANHIAKFEKLGIPWPGGFLWAGFAFQFAGALMVIADFHAAVGAGLLIVFTILANALYHRWWTMSDVAQRRNHMNLFFNNVGNLGGLLLVTSL
jgi:uncharacterized membrane protein YphA (DoxX/SURF4 family)